MSLTNNFKLSEFEHSNTAEAKGIDNRIPKEYLDNVKRLAEQLQIVRDAYGLPIIIDSGYRCGELNKLVGGAVRSDHRFAAAADIHTKSDTPFDNKKLFDLIQGLALKGKVQFRQIIDEHNYNWIHLSVNNQFNSHKSNQIVHLK